MDPNTSQSNQGVPTVTPTPIPPKPSPSKSKLPLILGGVILIVLIAGVSYFLGTQNNKSMKLDTTSQPVATPTTAMMQEPTSTPTPTADSTVDWQLYTNPKLGYSVKYPADYKVTLLPVSETTGVLFSGTDKDSFKIETYTGTKLADYKTSHAWWIESYRKDVTDIMIDGVLGKKFTYTAVGDTGNAYEMVVVEKNGKAYEFWAEKNENSTVGLKSFETALTTFTFNN